MPRPLCVLAVWLALTPGGKADERLDRMLHAAERNQARIAALESKLTAASRAKADEQRGRGMQQQIRAFLRERAFRESLAPSALLAGYDRGFYLRSANDAFRMRFNGRLQFRWTHYGTRSENRYLRPGRRRGDRSGFDIQRLRLGVRGHLDNPDLTYRLDLDADADGDGAIRYAWLNHRFSHALQVRAGVMKIVSTRAQMTSSGSLQFVDRPMVDAVFQLGRGMGLRVWGRLFDKRLDYHLDIVNALNSFTNRTIATDPAEHDNSPAIVLHAIWHALGDELGRDFKTEADLVFHASPALDLGFHYAFNEDEGDRGTTDIPIVAPRGIRGGFALTNTNGARIHQVGVEAAYKHRGLSITSEYLVRFVDVRRSQALPLASVFRATADSSTSTQHGGYAQVGYFLPIAGLERKIEAVARVGGVAINTGGRESTWEYAAGINYYIRGNNVKLQFDVTRIEETPITSSSHSLANVNDDALIFRMQLQLGL